MDELVVSTNQRSGFVQSLERGLAVIRALDADGPKLTCSEVARRADLTQATARRLLHTLVDLGYMRTDGRLFALRPRILEFGCAYLSSFCLPEIARPRMERLVSTIHQSSSMSVLDGEDIVYVVRVPMERIMTVAVSVGTRFPAYATSMGRVLLAGQSAEELDEWLYRRAAERDLRPLTPLTVTRPERLRAILEDVRAGDLALVDQELEEGLRAIAVPIRGLDRKVVAALNASIHATRRTLDKLRREVLPHLLSTTALIEADLRRSFCGAVGTEPHESARMCTTEQMHSACRSS